jgi:hypothetical protein
MDEVLTFGAPMDAHAFRSTFFLTALTVAVLATPFLLGNRVQKPVKYAIAFCGVVLALIGLQSAAWTTRSYALGAEGVEFRGLFSDTTLAYGDIESVERISGGPSIQRATRLAGNDGIWGYAGHWRNNDLGEFWVYGNDLAGGLVMLRTKSRTHLLAPDDPAGFTEALKARLRK